MSVVVVTGCGRGIGLAILERCLADGFDVVGLEVAASLAETVQTAHPQATVLVGDTADPASFERAAAAVAARGPLWGWVNNASVLDGGGVLHEADPARTGRVLAVNLHGYYWGCARALRTFVEQRSAGSIVNISSVHGRAGYSDYSAYDAAKGGVDALTRYIAVEYGPVGIRANAVAPGGVLTPGSLAAIEAADDPAALRRDIAMQNPLRRIAAPEEIAAVASFLLSEGASFLTGQSIAVDGGLTATCMTFPLDPGLAATYGLGLDGLPPPTEPT